MAVTFMRLYEQPFALHPYRVTGVSNAQDKPQFVAPQFSPNQFFPSCCIHAYVQQIAGCLFNHCQTLCTILWHPVLSLCHHHTPLSIIIINIKDWTSLICSVSRVTTVLAKVSSVFQIVLRPCGL